MAALSSALERMAKYYVDQINAGARTIDTIPTTVPAIIKNRVAEIISESEI